MSVFCGYDYNGWSNACVYGGSSVGGNLHEVRRDEHSNIWYYKCLGDCNKCCKGKNRQITFTEKSETAYERVLKKAKSLLYDWLSIKPNNWEKWFDDNLDDKYDRGNPYCWKYAFNVKYQQDWENVLNKNLKERYAWGMRVAANNPSFIHRCERLAKLYSEYSNQSIETNHPESIKYAPETWFNADGVYTPQGWEFCVFICNFNKFKKLKFHNVLPLIFAEVLMKYGVLDEVVERAIKCGCDFFSLDYFQNTLPEEWLQSHFMKSNCDTYKRNEKCLNEWVAKVKEFENNK